MENGKSEKFKELIRDGYEHTGKFHMVLSGANKDKKFPVYAAKGDIAAMIYNNVEDRIELVYKLPSPYSGKKYEESKNRIL